MSKVKLLVLIALVLAACAAAPECWVLSCLVSELNPEEFALFRLGSLVKVTKGGPDSSLGASKPSVRRKKETALLAGRL